MLTGFGQNVISSSPAQDEPSYLLRDSGGGEGPNISWLLLAVAAGLIFFSPRGYYQVREKKTGKRTGPRTYHY